MKHQGFNITIPHFFPDAQLRERPLICVAVILGSCRSEGFVISAEIQADFALAPSPLPTVFTRTRHKLSSCFQSRLLPSLNTIQQEKELG